MTEFNQLKTMPSLSKVCGGGEWQYVSKPTTETSTEAIIKFNHTDQMGLIAIIVGSQFSSDTQHMYVAKTYHQ